MNNYYVYIMATQPNGTLYIGITNNLIRRVYDHKNETLDGFTKKYKVHLLVWFDSTNSVESAIIREKQLKKWNRQWKINLIESSNPDWKDLSNGWY
ncbi:MAG: GIY-YIG nuclease family protein [Bacteroidetes bacterium]|nr:GIY-YIG nuclease family protein [Bacteroidota bacterium]